MKKAILFMMAMTTSRCLFAQNEDYKLLGDKTGQQKTANAHEVLTNYFKAGIDNLLGKEHSFVFNSSFYGLDSLVNRNRRIRSHEAFLRSNSLNLALKGDSSNNLTGLSIGFTFSLLNGRDVVYKKIDSADRALLVSKMRSYDALVRKIKRYIDDRYPLQESPERREIDELFGQFDKTKAFEVIKEIAKEYIRRRESKITPEKEAVNRSLRDADASKDYSKLDRLVKEALAYIIENERDADAEALLNGKSPLHVAYTDIAAKYARKPMWTFSPTYSYGLDSKQGKYGFASEFLVGFGKLKRTPWEFEAKTTFRIENDTAVHGTNYDSKPFSLSMGINKVLIENADRESKMELKAFTQLDHQFGTVPQGTEQNVFTFNSTLRINVYKALWLPITVRYDPESGNVFGLFSITANLGK